jgi:hypothetical protein
LVLDATEMSRLAALANCGHGNVSNTPLAVMNGKRLKKLSKAKRPARIWQSNGRNKIRRLKIGSAKRKTAAG